jgi:hypothetical protein
LRFNARAPRIIIIKTWLSIATKVILLTPQVLPVFYEAEFLKRPFVSGDGVSNLILFLPWAFALYRAESVLSISA